MKVVLNKCYGGFGLSDVAALEVGMEKWDADYHKRTWSKLIEVVERMGEEANGAHAKLKVVSIPDETTDWFINDYDGAETIYYVVEGKIYST